MKNIKLFEDFSNIPDFNDIIDQVVKFLEKDKKDLISVNKMHIIIKKAFDSVTLAELFSFLNNLGYKMTIYPDISPSSMNSRFTVSKINYKDPIGDLKYGLSLLIDSKLGEKQTKTCINILGNNIGITSLGNFMQDILIKKINDNEIDLLFWNGKYLVTGEFEQTSIHREDDMVALDFESYETSDKRDYILSATASVSWTAGYDIEQIDYIDFLN
jgi:hypothetical protein